MDSSYFRVNQKNKVLFFNIEKGGLSIFCWQKRLLSGVGLGFLLVILFSSAMADTRIIGDFSVTDYADGLGSITEVEAYTKIPGREVFFGLTCSSMSALPMIQVLMFNDATVSETPKFVEVQYQFGKQPGQIKMNGVLNVTDTAEEFSNKLVWDAKTSSIKSMAQLTQQYRLLLQELSAQTQVQVHIKHRLLQVPQYNFSLKGFQQIVKRYQSLCF